MSSASSHFSPLSRLLSTSFYNSALTSPLKAASVTSLSNVAEFNSPTPGPRKSMLLGILELASGG